MDCAFNQPSSSTHSCPLLSLCSGSPGIRPGRPEDLRSSIMGAAAGTSFCCPISFNANLLVTIGIWRNSIITLPSSRPRCPVQHKLLSWGAEKVLLRSAQICLRRGLSPAILHELFQATLLPGDLPAFLFSCSFSFALEYSPILLMMEKLVYSRLRWVLFWTFLFWLLLTTSLHFPFLCLLKGRLRHMLTVSTDQHWSKVALLTQQSMRSTCQSFQFQSFQGVSWLLYIS